MHLPDGRTVTRGDLHARANQLVHGLRALGLSAGDSVAVVQPNDLPMVELYFATLQAGFRLTPINHHLVGPEIAYIVDDSEAGAWSSTSGSPTSSPRRVRTRRWPTTPGSPWATSPGSGTGPSSPTDSRPPRPRGAPPARPRTTPPGTTGRPKGVRRALFDIDPDDMAALMTGLQGMFGIQPGEGNVALCGSPLYHTAPLMWFGNALPHGPPRHPHGQVGPGADDGAHRRAPRHLVAHGAHAVPPHPGGHPARGAGPLRRVAACGPWSTPRHPAHPRSSAR